MAWKHVRYETRRSAADAFAAVTSWPEHAVPFTRITVTPTGFTPRTGIGPIGFDDPMDVTVWDPPRLVELVKRGRVVRGGATISVVPTEYGSVVTWAEEVRIAGVPRWCDPVVRLLLGAMISLLLRRLLR